MMEALDPLQWVGKWGTRDIARSPAVGGEVADTRHRSIPFSGWGSEGHETLLDPLQWVGKWWTRGIVP